jgi:hypothetical protein
MQYNDLLTIDRNYYDNSNSYIYIEKYDDKNKISYILYPNTKYYLYTIQILRDSIDFLKSFIKNLYISSNPIIDKIEGDMLLEIDEKYYYGNEEDAKFIKNKFSKLVKELIKENKDENILRDIANDLNLYFLNNY